MVVEVQRRPLGSGAAVPTATRSWRGGEEARRRGREEEEEEEEGGGGGGGGGAESYIKIYSKNPHLAGGEQQIEHL